MSARTSREGALLATHIAMTAIMQTIARTTSPPTSTEKDAFMQFSLSKIGEHLDVQAFKRMPSVLCGMVSPAPGE